MIGKIQFTRMEFLTVITCVLVLFLCLGAGLNRGREFEKRIACQANMRVTNQAVLSFSEDNEGGVPYTKDAVWLWDTAYYTTDQIIAYGGHRDAFFCPSQKIKTSQDCRFWQFSQVVYTGQTEPVVEPTDLIARRDAFRLITYVFMFRSQATTPQIMGTPAKQWVLNTQTVSTPAETELSADAILSSQYTSPTNFSDIRDGACWMSWGISDTSNHLDHNQQPMGSNISFVDGHVGWRDFSAIQIRYMRGSPYFWW
jgi:prepilin-type processing-associated H-X9-DG protein